MQTLNLEYHAADRAARRAHVGVVGSGDLEILFEPGTDPTVSVRVRTTVDGFDVVRRRVLDAFFAHHPVAGRYELNDFGATPGIVSLRLLQVQETSRKLGTPGKQQNMSNIPASVAGRPELQALWHRHSFVELDARARAFSLLDEDTGQEYCDPFDRIESPWLEPQGLVPESDDGLVVVKGLLAGEPCVVIGIEGAFQGGSIGEVSGAKAACALQLAARDARTGQPISAVLLLETGGVRLQEGTLGLNAVAEILSALLELRGMGPVIGVVAGPLGSYGGMSIVAGLCTRVVLTHEGRLGFNGAQVIESEAGIAEFDSSDHALIWSVNGPAQRYATGLADAVVLDDVPAVRQAVITAVAAGVPEHHRSEELDVLAARLSPNDGGQARFSLPGLGIPVAPSPGQDSLAASHPGSAQQRRAES